MGEKLDVVKEIHSPARRIFPRRKYTMHGISETLQMDLMEFQTYKQENKNYRYILVVIDVFSKYVYAEPLKDKTGLTTTKAMEKILKKVYRRTNRSIINIQSDLGTEFWNSTMKRLFEKHNINHYSSFSFLKSSIVER